MQMFWALAQDAWVRFRFMLVFAPLASNIDLG